jgi:hypothetical protein
MHILPSPFSVRRVANSETQRFLKLLERPAGLFLRICAELGDETLGPPGALPDSVEIQTAGAGDWTGSSRKHK